jgi:hypothetical protein
LFHVAVEIPEEVGRLVNLQRLVSFLKNHSFAVDYLTRDLSLKVMVHPCDVSFVFGIGQELLMSEICHFFLFLGLGLQFS